MATAVRMPLMGMTMEEGAVTEWLVDEGAEVEKGQEILEFETDKINARVEAPAAGILGGIAAGPGDLVKVQGLLAWILEPGETAPAEDPDPPAAAAASAAPAAAPPPPAPAPVAAQPAPAPAPVAPALAPVAAQPAAVAPIATAPAVAGRIKASPLAKRVARELGIDLAGVVGSGPGGRIIEKDVSAAAAAPAVAPMPVAAAPPLAPAAAAPDVAAGQVIPLEGVRRVIAERMQQSLQGSAQVTLVAEADARRFHELRTELASRHESALGFRISYNDLLIRICAHALREHPRANSSLEGDAIRLHDVVNVGLAIEAGGDLVVANVKSADRKSLVEIASDLRGLVDRAQGNRLDLDDITGGTFTISNLGVYGIDAFTPVLNPPESAILGVGALREKAVARDGEVSAELSMTLSLTFDHRIIDGAPAARFLARIRELIEQPYLLL